MRRLLVLSSVMLLAAACGSSNPAPGDAGTDGGSDAGTDAGSDAGPPGGPFLPDGGPDFADGGCFANPAGSYEIINACTDAGYVNKVPVTPLLLSDGGLPPLP
jgi:hypothetical protein